MNLYAFGKSDIGKVRNINQDAFGIYQREDAGLFVVADGMGGYADGEKASQAVVAELSKWWDSFLSAKFGNEFQRMMTAIEQVIQYANDIIYKKYNQNGVCGTTATVLFIYKNCYGIVHAGDSRCYLSQGNKWSLLTVDEIWENQSHISARERMRQNHPDRGKLVNAIGVGEYVRCRIITDVVPTNAIFMLCTDGVYKFCEDRVLKKYARKCKDKGSQEEAVERLTDIVYKNGAKDNMTIIAVRCTS